MHASKATRKSAKASFYCFGIIKESTAEPKLTLMKRNITSVFAFYLFCWISYTGIKYPNLELLMDGNWKKNVSLTQWLVWAIFGLESCPQTQIDYAHQCVWCVCVIPSSEFIASGIMCGSRFLFHLNVCLWYLYDMRFPPPKTTRKCACVCGFFQFHLNLCSYHNFTNCIQLAH